jgi:hypothetical protein
MKRFIAAALFFLLALSMPGSGAGAAGGLNIEEEALSQRGSRSGGLADVLDVEILTDKSMELDEQARRAGLSELDRLMESALTGGMEAEKPVYDDIYGLALASPAEYVNPLAETNGPGASPTLLIILAGAVLAALSYMATMAFRKRKSRKKG